MKNLIAIFLLIFLSLAYSFKNWLSGPNNFLYTKEPYGSWSRDESFRPDATGYDVKINSGCAQQIYEEIEKTAPTQLSQALQDKNSILKDFSDVDYNTLDFKRFLKSKTVDVEFQSQGLGYATRFKWFKNNYVTFDDPSLKSGVRFSFSNKCIYDKDCLLADAIDYLFIKIGIKYFLKPAQADYLKENCVTNQKVFFNFKNKYNWGRSDTYYRNGAGIWLSIWYNLLGVVLLILTGSLVAFLIYRKKKKVK